MSDPIGDPDAADVARCRDGDRGAFDEIVRRHQSTLRRLVKRYVPPDDVEDVLQRTFERAFEKLDTFRGASLLRTWLFRIAVNTALNHVRATPPERNLELEEIPVFTQSLQTSKLVAAEVWRKVSGLLEELPPKQRLVLELRAFHELSFDEIAAVAECSEDSAKANYHHAIKRLRGLIPEL